MRLTLDTVGKTDWPRDTQRRPIYPDGRATTPLADVKSQAAHRWVRAVNADGSFGSWNYAVVSEISRVGETVSRAAKSNGVDTSGGRLK